MRLRQTPCDYEGYSVQPTVPAPRQPAPSGSVALLLRALAPRPTRRLTPAQRDELIRVVQRRWQTRAACASADPAGWYPADSGRPAPQVFRTCGRCPVRRSCLAVALLWAEDGVWGGTTVNDRRHGYRLLQSGTPVAAVLDQLLQALTTHQPPVEPAVDAAQLETHREAA